MRYFENWPLNTGWNVYFIDKHCTQVCYLLAIVNGQDDMTNLLNNIPGKNQELRVS